MAFCALFDFSLFLFFFSISFFFSIKDVKAWFDEGHMLVAGIAKLNLGEEEIEKFENYLNEFNHVYPGMGDMVNASVWPDHIKCTSRNKYCEGLQHMDMLEIFSVWHYFNLPYNPQNIDVPMKYYLPLRKTGSIWFLNSAMSSLASNKRMKLHKPSSPSYVTANIQLRLLIHVFGDMHQPLHCVELYCKEFLLGDSGGSSIKIKLYKASENENNNYNLHSFWDSAGDKYKNSWPNISSEEILKIANELMLKYPKKYFGERLEGKLNGLNFEEIADESYKLAINAVYSEFDFSKSYLVLPYIPSDAYIENARNLGTEQIVLAGYRLTNVLKFISAKLPPNSFSYVPQVCLNFLLYNHNGKTVLINRQTLEVEKTLMNTNTPIKGKMLQTKRLYSDTSEEHDFYHNYKTYMRNFYLWKYMCIFLIFLSFALAALSFFVYKKG